MSAKDYPGNRECRKCKRVYPIEMFPTYRSKGYEGRRHQCRGCVRAYRSNWEMSLPEDHASQYFERKKRNDARWKRKERRERYHTRLVYMRNAINAMIEAGKTRKEIAKLAGLNEKTVRRIVNGHGDRLRFHEPTERAVIATYWRVKEGRT